MLQARQSAREGTSGALLLGADPVLFPIDPNGNLTSKIEGADTWGYEWNADNELTRVTRNSVEQARFSYDPKGRRVEKVAGGVTTSYTYDRGSIIREVRGSTTLNYVQGAGVDEPLVVDDGAALSYFHADILGSIIKQTNGAGAVTLTRRYDAWGSLEVGGSEPGYAFTGREWDPETSLYYYRARYYDFRIGRFLSEDPIGLRGGNNFYEYGMDDPVNRTDPSGLSPTSCKACCWAKYLGCTVLAVGGSAGGHLACAVACFETFGPTPAYLGCMLVCAAAVDITAVRWWWYRCVLPVVACLTNC